MTSTVRRSDPGTFTSGVSTGWLASVLVGAALLELMILRIGTRTAIHVPGLEKVAGPYRLFAMAGRSMFFVAAVLLAVLLPYLVHDLFSHGRGRTAAGLLSFVLVAGLGAFRLVGGDVLAVAVTAVVVSLAVGVVARQQRDVRTVAGLFMAAFLMGALHTVAQSGFGGVLPGGLRQLLRSAELLAVIAAVISGPLIRRSLGLSLFPRHRLAWGGAAVWLVVTGLILANASTAHILMLWNFGLSGGLPAAVYGLAVASFVVAATSSLRCGRFNLALALMLFFLGGIGFTSTYQSGLVVVGLGLLDLTADNARAMTVR